MTNREGQKFGNYRLIQFLGAGSFADVYLGEHVLLETPAAIKILDARLQHQEAEKFREEARTIARLKHPHIIHLLDFGIENNTPFMVMDYAHNGTLKDRHPNGTILDLSTMVSYVKQIADALQCAHDEKIIHRDIKPANILLARRNEILLSDFGIAVIAHSTLSQKTEELRGTPAYMAPEQIQQHPTPASDQYSLGVMVYQWLCGSLPFEGHWREVAIKHVSVPLPPLHTKIPTISPAVEQVVLKALAKDPKQRFAQINDFAKALEQAVNYATDTPQKKSISRRTLIAGLTGGLIIVGGSGLTWWELAHKSRVFTFGSTPTSKPTRISISPTATSTLLYTYRGHTSNIAGVVWSPDGRYLASTAYDKTVQVWIPSADTDLSNLKFKGYLSGFGQSVTWSPDGRYLATADDNNIVSIWDWQATKNNLIFSLDTQHQLRFISWSPNGNFLAFASIGYVAQILDVSQVTSGRIIKTYSHNSAVNGVAWSSDGKYLATASKDKTVRVWQAPPSGNLIGIYPGHSGEVYAVAWSSDTIASASCDATIQVWNAFTQKEIFHADFPGSAACVHSVCWSPDGKNLVASSWNGKVGVWKPPQSEPIFIYTGKAASAVAWSPKGHYIASGSDDYTVQVWLIP